MRVFSFLTRLACLSGLALTAALPANADVTVQRIKVHSPAVAGNLEGNSAERDVIVVLPSDYATSVAKRYPVIYFLHGYMGSAHGYDEYIRFEEAMNGADANGIKAILVVPDSNSKHGGSMYSSSPTTGDFERFIAHDLVAYVDSTYRTLAKREARGLSGHSMGGYGTLRIGMKYPEVFSSLYAMSACCLSARTVNAEQATKLETISMEDAMKSGFMVRADLAAAAAWSPAPDKPPFFVDLATKDGEVQSAVLAQWAANAPLAMAPQYLPNLKRVNIALDVGDKDTLVKDVGDMATLLKRMGVEHEYTVYDGDHGNRVPQRFREFVLPFFAKMLVTE